MRWGTGRLGYVVAGGSIVGGSMLWCVIRGGTKNNVSPSRLSANEFNSLQNKDLLAEALCATHLPWNLNAKEKAGNSSNDGRDFTLTLYSLLGCPYCAKVEWVLRYHSVPFSKVEIDTLSGAGIPDSSYNLVPQIRLEPVVEDSQKATLSDAAGVYVVDSQQIISSLAIPLGFAGQLQDPRVLDARRWITERFQAVSFVATNGSWINAYYSYPHVTTSRYHNIVFRVVGASALYLLSQYKILPGLLVKMDSATGKRLTKDSYLLLEEELAGFVSRLQDHPSQRFHGGKEPDIVDVEMYAVTRIVDAHPKLRHVLRQGAFGEWAAAMDAELQKRARLVF